jgi:hypothetical protein
MRLGLTKAAVLIALLPAFAIDRTPLLLRVLRDLVTAGRVPDVPVYADSPMALAALGGYRPGPSDTVGPGFRPGPGGGGHGLHGGRAA